MKTLLILVNLDWYFLSHRLPVALYAKEMGYRVIVAADDTGRAHEIVEQGLEFIPAKINRSNIGLISNLVTLFSILKIYLKVKPDVIHNVSIKPVLYGSFIGRILGKKNIVNALGGLGYLFTHKGSNQGILWLFRRFTRFAFNGKGIKFILQNNDDIEEIVATSKIDLNKVTLIHGSGIDLENFSQSPEPENEPIVLLLHARMLWDKGIEEFRQMAIQLRKKYDGKVKCILCGGTDDNKKTIPTELLNQWNEEGDVIWIGRSKKIKEVIKACHIAVLPSYYREGLPKSLIEATAIGRPIITTDATGCRETVVHGKNGYLVPKKNVSKLVEYASYLIENKELRVKMGAESRLLAENKFDIKSVCEKTIACYET